MGTLGDLGFCSKSDLVKVQWEFNQTDHGREKDVMQIDATLVLVGLAGQSHDDGDVLKASGLSGPSPPRSAARPATRQGRGGSLAFFPDSLPLQRHLRLQ